MTDKKDYRSGMVAIVGRPNVGKSTLLNAIIGEKVSIVSHIPQTTRSQLRGIYSEERGQIVFIDTPGFHRSKDRLDQHMNKASSATFNDVDCLIYLVDTTRKIGTEEENIAHQLRNVKTPFILGLNKVDLRSSDIPAYVSFWEKIKGKPVQEIENFTMIALSGQNGENVEKLIEIVFDRLPQGHPLYDEDTIADTPRRIMIADIVREKLFLVMRKEVPHSIGVLVENIHKRSKNTLLIKMLILVERDTQKEIVIGKRGEILKNIGTAARQELEVILESKIFLELHVKTEPNWRDKEGTLSELGYGFI